MCIFAFSSQKWRPESTIKTGRYRKAIRVEKNNKMKMKKTIIFGMLSFAMLAFNSCKKDDDNSYVKTGTNTNTIQNTAITVHSSDWVWDNIYNQWYVKYYTTTNSQSAIYGYVMSGNGKEAMPYYDQVNGTTMSFAGNLFSSPSYILFEYYNLSTTLARPTSDQYFYLVAIPPAMIAEHPNVNMENYEEVKKTFNITE